MPRYRSGGHSPAAEERHFQYTVRRQRLYKDAEPRIMVPLSISCCRPPRPKFIIPLSGVSKIELIRRLKISRVELKSRIKHPSTHAFKEAEAYPNVRELSRLPVRIKPNHRICTKSFDVLELSLRKRVPVKSTGANMYPDIRP